MQVICWLWPLVKCEMEALQELQIHIDTCLAIKGGGCNRCVCVISKVLANLLLLLLWTQSYFIFYFNIHLMGPKKELVPDTQGGFPLGLINACLLPHFQP